MTIKNHVLKKISLLRGVRLIGVAVLILFVVWSLVKIFEPTSGNPLMMKVVTSADSISLHTDSLVYPIIYTEVPDLSELGVDERKKRFIHLMLPSILLAQKKINTLKQRVEIILEKQEKGRLTSEDSLFLNDNLEKFNAENPRDLIDRMHPHPVSIILAQAAIESGWGTSRFFTEANNVYGVWSFNSDEDRIKAGQAREGKSIFLRRYDSLFESVYDYLLVIARGEAYSKFRKARLESQNPYRLIWFLSNYSEKRLRYVVYLRQMIEFNDLFQFDHYRLVKINKHDPNWQKLMAS